MPLDFGDVVLVKIPITIKKIVGKKVKCTWMANNLVQTGIFNADDLVKKPSKTDTENL